MMKRSMMCWPREHRIRVATSLLLLLLFLSIRKCQLNILEKDEVSSIYTYDIVNSYIMPKPRAGQESDSSQSSPASKSMRSGSKSPEESKSDSSSDHEDSESGSQDNEQDNNKIQGIGDPNKGKATISCLLDAQKFELYLRQISALNKQWMCE